mmetsp:Transcript_20051/g.46694  ORF Transcript_20051/g.46694 Transcript_20051/m.46694 type:complete len:532 (-) Transcript_20051:12-1607(-)
MGHQVLEEQQGSPSDKRDSAGRRVSDVWEVASTMTPRSSRMGDRREEAAMQDFVGRHMTHMLQPLADHVRQIQAQVGHLESVIMSTGSRASQTKDVCEAQSKEIRSLQLQISQLSTRCEQQQAELATQGSDRMQLHADHDRTKAQFKKFRSELESSEDRFKDLQEKLQDLEGSTADLRPLLSKLQESVKEEDQAIRVLEDGQKALHYRNLTFEEDISTTNKKALLNQKAIADVVKRFEVLREEDLKASNATADRLTHFESMLGDLQRSVTRIDDRLRHCETTVADLRHHAENLGTPSQGMQVDLEKLIAEATGAQEAQARYSRLDQVEAEASSFRKSYAMEHRSIQDALEALGKQVTSTADAVESIVEAQQRHNSQIRKSEWSVSSLQADIKKVADQSRSLELEVSEHLPAWERELEAKITVQNQSLQQVIMDLKTTQQEVRDYDGRCNETSDRIATLVADLERLSKAHDLCAGSVSGLTKGFQDMSRSVVNGENGMLPPTRPASALPRIRPASALGASGTLNTSRAADGR